ncbi:replicative helicase loader/inhibitor [Siminovitchia fortis]|nr:replicative helicase loader/inhibitor [Siminovitchia fortis]WHY83822.1 replicative helicase loader/inhibitor [Siminovitchia fortis]
MTKRETFSLMARIAVYYEQFELDQKKLDSWHEVLKDCNLEELEAALHEHVSASVYPPKIADLLKKPASARVVPDPEETERITAGNEKPASREVVESELAKVRAILGKGRGEF